MFAGEAWSSMFCGTLHGALFAGLPAGNAVKQQTHFSYSPFTWSSIECQNVNKPLNGAEYYFPDIIGEPLDKLCAIAFDKWLRDDIVEDKVEILRIRNSPACR